MKHEVTSLNTKKLLAASLRKQMEKKPFSKITVSEIVKDCGVNRKTFYYHFEDIYALLKWMLEQDAVQVLHGFSLLQDYRDAILFVLDYVEKNQTIINCIYNSVGLDDLRRFFYDDFFDVMDKLIREVEHDAGLTLPKDFRKFLCQFYTSSLAGLLLDVIQGKVTLTHQEVVDNLSQIFRFSLTRIIQEKGNAES